MPTENADTLLLTGREMARQLRTTERSLYSYRQKGLPAVLLGGSLRYVPADVLAWLKANHTAPVPAAGKQVEAKKS